jgi:hypothetical protein
MILKGFPQAPWSQRLQPVDFPNIKDQAYMPIRDTVAFRKGGKVKSHMMPDGSMMLDSAMKKGGVVKKHKKGSKAMKDHMARLRAMRK